MIAPAGTSPSSRASSVRALSARSIGKPSRTSVAERRRPQLRPAHLQGHRRADVAAPGRGPSPRSRPRSDRPDAPPDRSRERRCEASSKPGPGASARATTVPSSATSIHPSTPSIHATGRRSSTSTTSRSGQTRWTRTSGTQGSVRTARSIAPVSTHSIRAPSPTPAGSDAGGGVGMLRADRSRCARTERPAASSPTGARHATEPNQRARAGPASAAAEAAPGSSELADETDLGTQVDAGTRPVPGCAPRSPGGARRAAVAPACGHEEVGVRSRTPRRRPSACPSARRRR